MEIRELGKAFFNQDMFMYGSRFNRRLNNTKIKNFFKVMRNLSIRSNLGFVVRMTEKPSTTNLNMEVLFNFPSGILKANTIESSEMTVREAIRYLKKEWVTLKHNLEDYKYRF